MRIVAVQSPIRWTATIIADVVVVTETAEKKLTNKKIFAIETCTLTLSLYAIIRSDCVESFLVNYNDSTALNWQFAFPLASKMTCSDSDCLATHRNRYLNLPVAEMNRPTIQQPPFVVSMFAQWNLFDDDIFALVSVQTKLTIASYKCISGMYTLSSIHFSLPFSAKCSFEILGRYFL